MKKLLAITFMLLAISDTALASQFGGMDAGSINSQYMNDLRAHEAATRAKNKSAIISTSTKDIEPQNLETSDLKSVIFINNSSIPSSELLNVIQDKINQPMTSENIAAIRKDIMKYYQEHGFFSAVAMVNSQNDKTGEIIIEVKEGGKNSIIIQE
ncbi:MAG: hypothetical protein LUG16_08095 [Candidatus Gastranaerophilales bacterium]|nr:hypothetical protein [Candidatus Gastranaerophilales bacterium]